MQTMEWSCYKALCDRPDVLSRWMLERTVELLERAEPARRHGLVDAVRVVLAGEPLPRPVDHSGPPATDMFAARLNDRVVHATLAEVEDAAAKGWLAGLLGGRSPVGFVAAWREYALHVGSARASGVDGDRLRSRLPDIATGGAD